VLLLLDFVSGSSLTTEAAREKVSFEIPMPQLNAIRRWYWRRTYRPGRTVSRFLVPDIRRDVEVIDASKLSDGLITARTRTWNVLYHAKGIEPKPPYGEAGEIEIKRLWDWSGKPWGGSVPASTDDAG
jgi:hypothetical protein